MEKSVTTMLHSGLFGSSPPRACTVSVLEGSVVNGCKSPSVHALQCSSESSCRAQWLWLLSSSSSDDEIFLVEDPGMKCAPFSSLALFAPVQNGISPPPPLISFFIFCICSLEK